MFLSEQIDEEYEVEQEALTSQEITERKEFEEEVSFIIEDVDIDVDECTEAANVSSSNVSSNRSRLARVTCVDVNAGTQASAFYDLR